MYTNNYYTIARNDYLFLQSIKDSNFYNKIAVEAQQVAEKYLKHIVDCFCFEHPAAERTLKTHNLVNLYRIIEDCAIALDLDEGSLSILKDYYFNAKYPGDEFIVVTKDRAEKCVLMVEEIREKIEGFLATNQYCTKCGLKLNQEGNCTNQFCS